MNEKHREVHCWLEKVFGGDTVPPYEINTRTIDLLYTLKERNEKQNKAAEIVIEDLQQETEEYKAEADRIGAILHRVGLSTDTLSQSGSTSLKTLANVANILEVKDTSDTRFQVLLFHWWEFISLLLGLSEMSRETMRVEESRRTEQKICSQLFFKTKNALQRLNSLQKALENIEDEVKHQGPDLQKKAKQAAYLQSKSREYKKHIQHYQLELTSTGADPSMYHQTLVKRAEELEELKQNLQPLRAKLDSYHKLPPDLALSKVKVEEAKLELAKLEEELNQHIDMMHV